MQGCTISLDAVSGIVQEGVDAGVAIGNSALGSWGAAPVPSGGSPLGTGQWSVLPDGVF